ncbi:hypothetical protein [Hymenobacter elongatus]|uniref:Uncharacterized protein n=1 Tax=Hymenobacter elongatus TaxID=877208 RepID=A0A4Z0PI45_9BACT|nr:hypothetical protein [Hymenobacter elongatus]TGE14504.1 hypothetical protein E5J99_15690 [Hymenobacter elongatus]
MLTALESTFGIVLSPAEKVESSIGTTLYPFFEANSPLDNLKINAFADIWFPDELDIHVTGAQEQNLLFCIVIDKWPGIVLRRTSWLS